MLVPPVCTRLPSPLKATCKTDSTVSGRAGITEGIGLSKAELARIQAFADKYGVEVKVVGSRAAGTAGPASDFDYIIGGNSKIRAAARRELPRGAAGGEIHPTRGETGIDVFNGNQVPLDPTRPHVIITPKQGT